MPSLPRFRSLPDPSIAADQVGDQGWQLADLLLPAMTLRDSALRHNVALHAAWCQREGVLQAPHVKTHMSPELVKMQLAAGAWGMTAASVHQARFLAALGVKRILLCHQLADRAVVRALVELLRQHPDVAVMPLVDSTVGVELLAELLAQEGAPSPVPVLVELGIAGGRTGARNLLALEAVARAVSRTNQLSLVGVEAFEGVLPSRRDEQVLRQVDEFLEQLAAGMARLDELGFFDHVDHIIYTGGGSAYPDRVAQVAQPKLSKPVQVIVRAGATITHDHGAAAAAAPLDASANDPLGALRPALELWAAVVSTPEPGLAIANFGRRDAPFDIELPPVLEVRRGSEAISRPEAQVLRLNDQHAFLRHDGSLQIGDVLRLGPVHPCTAFDKWPLIPILDDADAVIAAASTWF